MPAALDPDAAAAPVVPLAAAEGDPAAAVVKTLSCEVKSAVRARKWILVGAKDAPGLGS